MDVNTLNMVLAAAGVGLFVVPTFASLLAHLRTQKQRSFSHVVRPVLHAFIAIFRGAMSLGVAAVAVMLIEEGSLEFTDCLVMHFVVFTLDGLIVWRERDRRLFIDAETGFITWKRLSLPFLGSGRVAYIDSVAQLQYSSRDLDLFGLDTLEERYSLTYNGNQTVRGHYPKRVIAKLAENFNRYHEIFFKHDSEGAKETRRMSRERRESSLEPGRQREQQQQSNAAHEDAADAHSAAAKAARAEEKKRRDVESKFRS